MVIGCSGAGKSWLSKQIARELGLPLVSLDALHWQPGWRPSEPDVWLATVRRLVESPRWVMDGNYSGTFEVRLPHAEAIVFLDQPRWRCIMGVLLRTFRHFGRVREELAPGCPERFDWPFLLYVWRFRARHRAGIVAALARPGSPRLQIVLKSRSAIKAFAAGLPRTLVAEAA